MAFRPIYSIKKKFARRRSFPAIGRREGASFILDPKNWIDNRLLAGVPFENEQVAFVRQEIRRRNITIVLDIGANIGLYTVLLGREATVTTVYAFEPVAQNFNQLLGNVFANRLDAKVVARRIGASDTESEATIHIDPRSTGVSRLDLTTTDRNPVVFEDRETILLRRLDDVLNIDGVVMFAKIDVEGMAEAVVRGMPRILNRNTGLCQIEVTDVELGVVDLIESHGWQKVNRIGPDMYFSKG